MASVHRDPRNKSPFFYAAFTLPDGRRAFRSTKEKSRAKAEEVARGWEKAARLGRAGTLTEGQARRVLDDILENVGQGRMNVQEIEEFLTGWLESKRAAKAAGTVRRYQDVVIPFLEHLGPTRRRAPLASLAARDVATFRDDLLRDGLSNKSANLALKTLRGALNTARRQGLLVSNPAEAVDTLPDDSAERGTFTPEELRALLAVADAEWQGVILLGCAAGLRIGDAARLRWGNVHLSGPVPLLRFQPLKRSRAGSKLKPLEVPIVPDLESYLRTLSGPSPDPATPLFPTLSKKKGNGRTGLSNTFTALLTRAGIANGIVSAGRGGRGRAVFRLSFHSLRHTFISQLANAGVSKELRMKLAGHTSAAHDRYTHLEADTLRDAMRTLPRVVPG